MSRPTRALLIVVTAGLSAQAFGFVHEEGVPVEPAELGRRRDLVGKEVVVDDRVSYYVPRTGSEPDELQLKRTPITFLVPRRLRPAAANRLIAVEVRALLKREGSRLVCEVTALAPLGNDLDRLERGLAGLPTKDFQTRRSWARWAQRRAKDFKDEALAKRARALEAEALQVEADTKRLGVDAPREWLAMAQEARRRQVAEPEPSALAHRALRAILARATTAEDLQAVIGEIEAFWKSASTDREIGQVNLARWQALYEDDPAATYRKAPPDVRKALDRRLWAEATERLLELQTQGDIKATLDLAERAATMLPEKPELPARLIEKGVAGARRNLGTLRLADVRSLAGVLRDRLKQPGEALDALRDWLKIQRDRLSDTDAEGPVALANLYDELLQDRVTAAELLRKAWRIDPNSKEIAEAFRTRGFRKVQNDWVETVPGATEAGSAEKPTQPPGTASQGLRGLTPEEVRLKLGGKPDRVNHLGSRGQMIEQWIYRIDTKRVRYVNLLRTAGESKARVVADYTLPGPDEKGGLKRAR
jgi:tetratricopeptide (TPR) repeat protein